MHSASIRSWIFRTILVTASSRLCSVWSERIESLSTEADTPERERRLALLQRQRSSLHELLARRQSLANQLESAGLMLQNLKLDLLKLRSSGVGSAIEDVTSATQEARALSREIGLLVEASDDLKKI